MNELSPEAIDLSFVPRRMEPAAAVELDGDEVLYLADPPMLFTLNTTARIVWHSLDGEISIGQLADELAEEFEVPPEQMRHDVVGVVREFGRGGLLHGVMAQPEVVEGLRVTEAGAGMEVDDAIGEEG